MGRRGGRPGAGAKDTGGESGRNRGSAVVGISGSSSRNAAASASSPNEASVIHPRRQGRAQEVSRILSANMVSSPPELLLLRTPQSAALSVGEQRKRPRFSRGLGNFSDTLSVAKIIWEVRSTWAQALEPYSSPVSESYQALLVLRPAWWPCQRLAQARLTAYCRHPRWPW